VLVRKFEAVCGCVSQFSVFVAFSVHWSYGVDDVPCLEVAPGCDDGFSCGYSAPFCDYLVAFFLDLRSSFSSDGSRLEGDETRLTGEGRDSSILGTHTSGGRLKSLLQEHLR